MLSNILVLRKLTHVTIRILTFYHTLIDGFSLLIFAKLEIKQQLQGYEHLNAVENHHEEAPPVVVRVVVAIQGI
jgi:hypothetical protein